MSENCRESEITRKKILHAAKNEFALHGYDGARMSAIADTAGVNQALLHYHFAGKENIYREIAGRLIESVSRIYSEKIKKTVEEWNITPDLKLCAVLYILINSELYIRDEDYHRIVAHEFVEGKGIIYELVRQHILPQIMSLEEILKEGKADGFFEMSNTVMFTLNIFSFIKNISHGKEMFRGTEYSDELYKNRFDSLYDYMREFSFKTLRPSGCELIIPDIDLKMKNQLSSILKEMKDELESI